MLRDTMVCEDDLVKQALIVFLYGYISRNVRHDMASDGPRADLTSYFKTLMIGCAFSAAPSILVLLEVGCRSGPISAWSRNVIGNSPIPASLGSPYGSGNELDWR